MKQLFGTVESGSGRCVRNSFVRVAVGENGERGYGYEGSVGTEDECPEQMKTCSVSIPSVHAIHDPLVNLNAILWSICVPWSIADYVNQTVESLSASRARKRMKVRK